MKKNNRPVLFYFMIMLFLLIHTDAFSQIKQFTGKDITQPFSRSSRLNANHPGKYLKKYSVYLLNTNEIALYAKSNSRKAQFVLNLSAHRFKLEVEPNEMRGANFKAVAITNQGSEELAQTFPDTYKGIENGDPSNIVRLNINDTTFEGYVRVGKKWLYLDKLNRFVPNESNDKIVVYDGEDVIPDPTQTCGSEALSAEKKKFEPTILALTGSCHFLEIATEADYEYYQAFSSNANAALSRIRNILNLVEGLYTSSYNVKFIIRYQQIWTTISDPYSGTTMQEILPQFKDWWDANRTSISRDETHMFSGIRRTNSTIGIAYLDAVCNTSWYYSCQVNLSPVTNATVALSAHELAHNFGAGHDDGLCNGRNIMCPSIQTGTPEWSARSLTEISGYIASSGSCMTESFPENLEYFGTGANLGYLKLIAASYLKTNTSSGAVRLSTAGFGYIEAGFSVVLKPTNPASLGFLAPVGSTLLIRISDVIATCDPLTATSPASLLHPANPAAASVTESSAIQISPNPFSSSFRLTFNSKKNGRARLIIYNSLGVKVKEKTGVNLLKGFNNISLDGSDFTSGMYIIEINMGIEKTVKKIVKL